MPASTKPKWDLQDALRRGRIAQRLASKHSAVVEPRLSAGLTSTLQQDRSTLGDAGAHSIEVLTGQKTSTSQERRTSADGHALVMAVRNAVARTPSAAKELRTAIGVGDGLKAGDTKGVIAALRAIVANGPALGACGVVAADIGDAEQTAKDLASADAKQGDMRDARAGTTEDRLDTQRRLEAAIDEISSRGALAFRRDAAVRARFERLVATSGPTADDEAAGGAEPPPISAPPQPA